MCSRTQRRRRPFHHKWKSMDRSKDPPRRRGADAGLPRTCSFHPWRQDKTYLGIGSSSSPTSPCIAVPFGFRESPTSRLILVTRAFPAFRSSSIADRRQAQRADTVKATRGRLTASKHHHHGWQGAAPYRHPETGKLHPPACPGDRGATGGEAIRVRPVQPDIPA